VKTVDKVEHNHPDLILQLPEGPTALIELTVATTAWWSGRNSRRTSADWEKKHKRHRRPSHRGRDEGRDSEADGSFAGEVEGVGFRWIRQSRMEDTQVVRLKIGGVWQLPDKPIRWGARVLSV
jgi:hypothetical protein